jgi:hypothetical protein
MRQSSTDLIASVAVILVGIFFLILARQIETSVFQTAAEALVGPAMVPTIVAALLIGLGALELGTILLRRRSDEPLPENPDPSLEGNETTEITAEVLIRIVTTVCIGFAYVWLLSATGYIISSAFALAALLILFGTRSALKITLITVVGTAVYYGVFIWLMGVYSPVGWLIHLG